MLILQPRSISIYSSIFPQTHIYSFFFLFKKIYLETSVSIATKLFLKTYWSISCTGSYCKFVNRSLVFQKLFFALIHFRQKKLERILFCTFELLV